LLGCRGEPTEIVRSGEDVAFQLKYELSDPKELQNAVVQIKFAGNLGQSLFACLSNAASSDPLVLTPRGRLICRIPRLPLSAGIYTYTVWCSVGGVLEDFVRDAGTLTVTEGDFFGTGRLPPNNLGEFLVAHTWEAS
jgi:lipopolysaccharide transport system ATP-binding protein